MTGGSLGLRTVSYGSLQQQLQNGVFFSIHATPLIVRKNSKTLLSSYKEKERFLSRICKFACRRRVGMVLVVVVSVLVFMSVLSTMCKGCQRCYEAIREIRILLSFTRRPRLSEFFANIWL